jgi:hypothetical protein
VLGVNVGITGGHGDTLHIHVDDLRDFLGDLRQAPANPPAAAPFSKPRFHGHRLADLDGDGGEETVVFFYKDEPTALPRFTGLWVDLAGSNQPITAADLDDPARDPVCHGQWPHQLAVVVDPWPTVFFDRDSDGQFDQILQAPTGAVESVYADRRWTRFGAEWVFDVPPPGTTLLAPEHFSSNPARSNFIRLLPIIAKRIRGAGVSQ